MELPPTPGTRRVSISNPQETSGSLSVTPAMLPTHPSKLSVDPSKVSAFRESYRPSFVSSGHSGMRGPTSILQRSSLNPPEGLQGKESNVSSVHYADEEGKALSAKDKDKDKEKSKGKSKGKNKGTGNRLLNMLKKTLQGSESEESTVSHETTNLIPFGDVVGCLAVHIRSCRQFSHRFIVQQHINLFIRISVNNIIKCTKLRNLKAISEKNYVLRFDEVKYFSVQVPRRQDDERNNIFLELMKDGGDSDRPAHALGSAESHLYEVIQKGCFTEILQMMHRNSVICRVEVEFMFSYGSFGYGFSHQLKPLQKIIEPSMFMNIAPPPERTDPVTNVITPQRIEYPAFLSPEFNVTVGAAETSQAAVVQLEKLREKPRERLEKMKEEYRNLNTWIEKSEYLKNLINPKVSNKDSKESNSSELSESSSNPLEDQHSKIYDIHHRKSESTSNEWVQSGEKEGLVIPVLRLLDQGYTEPALYKGGESAQPADALLPPIHTLQIIEEDEIPRFQRTFDPEDMLYEDRKSVLFSADENLIPKCPTISKLASSLQEVKTKREKVPHFSDALIIPDKPLGQENTNMKGRPSIQLRKSWERRSTDFTGGLRKVAFAQREYTTPVFRAELTEFKPKRQFQKPSKGGFDPFLRNINSKMSFKKKKDQDAHRYSSAFSTEILEHEDQDPPYPEQLRSAESSTPWAEESSLITTQTASRKNSLPSDSIASTVMISDRKNKLSHDSTINTPNTSSIKNIFASDNPVVTLTKLSDSDNKLSTDSRFNITKPSDRRLSSDLSSRTTKPPLSDTKLYSDHSFNTTKPSDTKLYSNPSINKLSQDPSSNATQLSGTNRLSHYSSINENKSSDPSNLSHDPSIISTKSSDPNRLSHDPSIISTKSSDPNRLSHDPSIISTKSSDPNRLSHDPSIISRKSSDPNRLSHDPSIISRKSSDPNRLSHDPSIISTKSSDPNRLSHDPSIISRKSSDPNRLSHDPSIISRKSSDPNRLSHDPSIISTKSSDPNRLSHDPSIISTKSSDPNRLSHDPSIISRKSSDPNRLLSHDPSIISTKSSDPNRLSHDPSIISTKSSDPNNLSHDPSIISTKSSDPNNLSHDPSIISRKSSDPNRLSHDPSIISTKSSDPNRLSHDPSIISTKSSDPNRLSHDPKKLISGNTAVYSDATTNTAESQVTMNKLALDPTILTVDSSNRQSLYTDIDEQLPNVPLPTFQREPSVTGSLSLYCSSSSVSFTSDTENLKQSLVLRSILSKNLQDLSHELLSKSEVFTNARVTQGSCSSPPSMYTRPSDGTDDRVFEKVQDIHSRLSSKDILNSQTLLSPVIRSAQDSLPEDEPGKASDADYASDKLSEAAETKFPMHRKSSLKKKHLASEASGSEQDLNGGIYDYIIKQIFTAPIFSQLGIIPKTLSEAQMVLQDQVLTPWESRESSHIVNYEEKYNGVYLSQSKSVISQIIQLFSANTFVESGIINVVDLDKAQQRPLLDTQKASPKEELQTSTEQLSDVNSQSKAPSRQNTPNSSPQDASWSGVEYTEGCQSTSKYPTPDGKPDSPTDFQKFDAEEMELRSAFDSLSSSLRKVKVTNTVMLKAFLKNIFKVFLKYSQSNGKSDTELEGPSQPSFSCGTAEYLENLQETPDKADRKPILNPKLSVFLEKLSELEVKNLKSELSKHIQHYLVERLSESGHITKEDLPKIHRNLYQMNEDQEAKGQSSFKENYSETVEKIMSFVSNFNHCFIDKHLEGKLRSFLSEILQNYFLKNLPVSNLFNENDAMTPHPSVSSMGSECTLRPLHGLGHDTESESFGSEGKINMNYPFSNSLQNYLNTLSENELTSIKGDLSKYLHALFLEKLYNSGLVTERQLKEISQKTSPLHPPSTPLKFIKTDLPFRDESYFMKENLEEQKKYSKIGQNTTLQTCLEDKCGETEVSRKKEKGSCFSHNSKDNQSTIWEQKNIYNRESKPLSFVKVQPSPNKNIQANPTSKSPERPADIALKKHKKEHYFTQLPQAENSFYRTEIQDPYIWDGGSKTIQSKTYFEKTLKVKTFDKRENHNIYKLSIQEKPDTGFSPYPKLPACKVPRENENGNRLSFPTWVTHVNPDNGEQSKLDQYCQKLKGNNNNNKKHLVTFAQFKNEMETLYRNPYEACNEKCTKISDSRSFKYKDNERNSRPFFFPEVLKRENMKSKRKERDHPTKPKRPFHKIVRILPATLPTTRPHLRKSVPRTLLHWTARRTVHDCFDRFEERVPSVKCPKKSKSRARLLGKSPDDPHNQAKHCARPYTAPEPNKRRECATRKFASPHMVSAGLVHIHATPEYEIRKMRSKRKLKEDIEKRSLICDIMQMLHAAQ
ncbi:cation channel sperm-associated targeting subunit tau [Acomys russatus]|uniref:cation channel sperm-associated targeting subunit tau n=1 Tax=Acomys russatus TaxID=60746 RepID=UPI0021E28B8B|nr:cation channel sperm-associated targeting subunit tau [Acomys russatus]